VLTRLIPMELKLPYSEKAQTFGPSSTYNLTPLTKGQVFVAFSQYLNFKNGITYMNFFLSTFFVSQCPIRGRP
jgi:hypothetical protein